MMHDCFSTHAFNVGPVKVHVRVESNTVEFSLALVDEMNKQDTGQSPRCDSSSSFFGTRP